MPRGKNFKRRVRARMRATGERYTQARKKLHSVGGGAPAGVQGWILAGTHPVDYEIGVETDLTYQGGRVAYLRSVVERAPGFGTVMQTISGDDYRERRVRFSAAVQAQEIESWAGLWMRVDGHTTLAFDNMQSRPLRGWFDWRHVEVVLDVPSEATAVAFGLLLTGRGADPDVAAQARCGGRKRTGHEHPSPAQAAHQPRLLARRDRGPALLKP